MSFSNLIKHFNTITEHKLLVMKYCFKVGLYKQGLLHDLSKYSPSEFIPGVKYYQGTCSPNVGERNDLGYSKAWMHHKGRNKHHFEYWNDHVLGTPRGTYSPLEMPKKYVAEMFCDRLAATRIYNKGHYNSRMPLEYYEGAEETIEMHPNTKKILRFLLEMNYKKGEEYTLKYIKKIYLKK